MSNTKKSQRFLLVGNGPYLNRGCEAIIRGTTCILDAAFGNQTAYVAASFGTQEQIRVQATRETCSRIRHEWLAPKSRVSMSYLKFHLNRFLGTSFSAGRSRLPARINDCIAALQIGGDNYSLDYGYPRAFLAIDDQLLKRGIPLVLWGASVGPFDSDPVFEREMIKHLSKFRLIAVRESQSFRYLRDLGLTNICHVADPAFLMEPEPVLGFDLPKKFVGLNFSPLMAKWVTHGNVSAWAKICATGLSSFLLACDLPVVLIPHVVNPTPENNDHAFLQMVATIVNQPERINVLDPGLNAPQIKWVIGEAVAFGGARTHSTIAAMSLCVPTLSFAYSTKAWGINRDVFGHTKYCLNATDLKLEHTLRNCLLDLIEHNNDIRRELGLSILELKKKAMNAGAELRRALGREA